MGLIARLFTPDIQAASPGPADDFWYGPVGTTSVSGVRVDADTAMTISAVFRCVSAIAQDVAGMPLITYRRLEGGKERAPDHPLYGVLHDQPNQWQTAFQWWEMLVGHLLLRGNFYNRIVPGTRGFADQLIPLHPGRMEKVELLANFRKRYTYRHESGQQEVFSHDEIFHVPGLSSDGITGLSVVRLARDSMGLGMATEQYGARLFSQNASPGGVLQHPGKLGEEAATRLSKSWQSAHSGLNTAHKVAVLEEGLTWTQVGMSNEDSQFLETRSFQVEEIARWFGVPLHRIGHTEKATSWGTGIEQFNLGYLQFTLRSHLVRLEQAIRRDLILEPEKFFVEFLMDGLLRGDAAGRSQALQTQFLNGALTLDEWRAIENRNPLPDGKGQTHFMPLNLTTLEKILAPDPSAESLIEWRRGLSLQAHTRTAIMTINEVREELGLPSVAWGSEPFTTTDEDSSGGSSGANAQAEVLNALNDRAKLLAEELAGIVIRREITSVTKAATRFEGDTDGFVSWLDDFYEKHTAIVEKNLRVDSQVAVSYAQRQRDAVLSEGPDVVETWEETVMPELIALALGEGDIQNDE